MNLDNKNNVKIDTMTKVTTALIGGTGFGASELVSNVVMPNMEVASEATSIIVQIIIGIATLVGLFRKKRN